MRPSDQSDTMYFRYMIEKYKKFSAWTENLFILFEKHSINETDVLDLFKEVVLIRVKKTESFDIIQKNNTNFILARVGDSYQEIQKKIDNREYVDMHMLDFTVIRYNMLCVGFSDSIGSFLYQFNQIYRNVFYISGYMWTKNNRFILQYEDILSDYIRFEKDIFIHSYGFGDCMITLPYLLDLVLAGKRPKIFCIGRNCKPLIEAFLPELPCVHVDADLEVMYNKNIYINAICRTENAIKCTELMEYTNDKLDTYTQLCEKHCIDPQKAFHEFVKRRDKMDWSIYNLDSLRKKYDKIIGFQFVSSSSKYNGNYAKIWPVDDAQKFIDMCNMQNIAVLNLEPCMKTEISGVFDYTGYNIIQTLGFIGKLDAVVGIDSFVCHGAGVMGIPNLRLALSSLSVYRNNMMHFTPLSMNYSVYPADEHVRTFDPQTIFNLLCRILYKKFPLEQSYIPLQNKISGYHYEYLGDKKA